MRKSVYVFLSHPIDGIGGAQTYVCAKREFLVKQGFDVLVLSSSRNTNNIIINDFLQYKDETYPELLMKPFVFAKHRRRQVLQKMISKLSCYKSIIIESLDINSGEWGELLAKSTSAKHVIFLLSETFGKYSSSEYNFLNYKLSRRELFGITDSTISLLFKTQIKDSSSYKWAAKGFFAPKEVACPEIDKIEKKDFNIGSIGRIKKEYVPYMLEKVYEFSSKHTNRNINLILCGGSHDTKVENEICDKFKNLPNVTVHFIGQIFPMPKQLFRLCDVFISVAGSSLYSLIENIPTITIDANDFQAIGIMGYTTMHSIYRKDEPPQDIAELLHSVLIDKVCDGVTFKQIPVDGTVEYSKQLSECQCSDCEYYNVDGMRLSLYNVMQFIINLGGDRLYNLVKRGII